MIDSTFDKCKDWEGIVYKITNLVNGRSYIGKSERSFHRRYLSQGWGKMTHNRELKTDFDKYGPESFRIDILVHGLKGRELAEQEEKHIRTHDTIHPHGYNLIVGVEDYFISDATRKKISQNVRIAKSLVSHPWKGKTAPEDTRIKMQLSHRGRLHPKARAVVQINKETKETVAVFSSIADAETKTGINQDQINKVCMGHRKTTGGYIWKHLVKQKVESPCKKVLQIDIETGEILREHPSIVQASKYVDGRRSNISAVCRGKMFTSKGFKWAYKDSYETT